MKKNKALTAAMSVLSLTMISMCAIGGTFAKYTTEKEGHDTATVAAWGITLSVTGDNTLYDDLKSGNEVAAKVTANDLAAPGTYQKLATVELSGTPEVSYKISVDVDLELEHWEISSGEYCPLVFSVDGTSYSKTGTVADLEVAVEGAIAKAILGAEVDPVGQVYSKEYAAGTPVVDAANSVLIDWVWAFEVENAKDTELGTNPTKATIDFDLKVTVEQVD